MSFRDDLRGLADDVRGIAEDFGVREYTVTIRTETYADEAQLGNPIATSDLTLSPAPKVRESSKGRALVVGPITPAYVTSGGATGGYTDDQLNPVAGATAAQKVTYRVTGDNGTRTYVLDDITTDRGYRYMLTLVSDEHDGPR